MASQPIYNYGPTVYNQYPTNTGYSNTGYSNTSAYPQTSIFGSTPTTTPTISSNPLTYTDPSNANQIDQMTPQIAVQTILQNYSLFQNAVPGNNSGSNNGCINMQDIQSLIQNNQNLPANVKAAAQYLENNPAVFQSLDTASNGGNPNATSGGGDPDGLFSQQDCMAFLNQNPQSSQAATQPYAYNTPQSSTTTNPYQSNQYTNPYQNPYSTTPNTSSTNFFM